MAMPDIIDLGLAVMPEPRALGLAAKSNYFFLMFFYL